MHSKPTVNNDRMVMKNMKFYGRHGVFAEENRLGQHYEATVFLTLDLSKAGRSDELKDTVDYAAVYEVVRFILEETESKLIEAVAEQVAEAILRFDNQIQVVEVHLTKPNPPFKVFFDGVTVEIIRSRDDLQHVVMLGFGSNVGDRIGWLREAVKQLDEDEETEVYDVSNIYETAPVGPVDQGPFLNMNALVVTRRSAESLLSLMQQIEQNCGRERTIHWGPRTLDLDLLLYNQDTFALENLQVPHPFLAERAFVLVPMNQLLQKLLDGHCERIMRDLVLMWREKYRCDEVLRRDGGDVNFFAEADEVFCSKLKGN